VTSVRIALQSGMRFEAVGTDGVPVVMDSDPQHGGAGMGLRPLELLLAGLGGCTAMDVLSILRKKRQVVTAYRLEVDAVQQDEYPHVFTHITIRHIVEGRELSEEAVGRAIELSETKYCPAYAMLAEAAPIDTEFEVRQTAEMTE
jgi:putative redox protein